MRRFTPNGKNMILLEAIILARGNELMLPAPDEAGPEHAMALLKYELLIQEANQIEY